MRRWLVVLTLLVLLFPIISASIDSEIKKITHYAEEYETGNINYAQLVVKISSARQRLNEILGAIDIEGGLLKQEQIKSSLGDPTQETKWVWIEEEHQEKKLDYEIPVWEKRIFDGKKIQIRLNAYPSIRKKFSGENIVYQLHFSIDFKKPSENLDMNSKIDKIKSLAEKFNSENSKENGLILAKESVSAERIFETYLRQKTGSCEDVMNSIFGSENKRPAQKTYVQEIEFFSGEDYEVIANLEMCDECEWNWVNLDVWFDTRGRGMKTDKKETEVISPEDFKHLSESEIKTKIVQILEKIKTSAQQEDFSNLIELKSELWALNDAWNQKANDVWEEVEEKYPPEFNFEDSSEDYPWIKREIQKRNYEKQLRQENYEKRKEFYSLIFEAYEKKEFYYEQQEWEKRLVQEFLEKGEEICDDGKDNNDNSKIDCSDDQCGGQFCGKLLGVSTIGNETIEEEVDMYCIEGVCQPKYEEVVEETEVCGNHICEGNESLSCKEDCTSCPIHDSIECDGIIISSGADANDCSLKPTCISETTYCDVDEECQDPLCGIAGCVDGTCQVVELTECQEPECTDGEKKKITCESGEDLITGICVDSLWISVSNDCNESVKESVCGNNECEKIWGEDSFNCPTDCEWVCGNGMCEPFENDKCDEDCNPEISNKKDYGGECTSDEECIHNKCRAGKCSYSNSAGEGCEGNWQCESEKCENNTCLGSDIVEEVIEEDLVGGECEVKEDCGGENDVCSNGNCVTLPQTVKGEPEIEISDEIDEEIPEEDLEEEEEIEDKNQEPEENIEEDIEEIDEEKIEGNEESEQTQKSSSETNTESTQEENSVTGGIIFTFFRSIGKLTGYTIDEENSQDQEQQNSEDNSEEQESQYQEEVEEEVNEENNLETEDFQTTDENQEENDNNQEPQENFHEENYNEDSHEENYEDDWEDKKREEEKDRQENECNERCERECKDRVIAPCVDKCVFGEKGEINDLDECEKKCKEENDLDSCEEECFEKCMKYEETWEEPEWEEHQEEKGVFVAGGMCRASQGKTEGGIWFSGWGDPFEQVQVLKQTYYSDGSSDWCKDELENLIKQRKEFEKSLNSDFVNWFFSKYLANSAEDWEEHQAGIYELFWNSVDNSREIAMRMQCLGLTEIPYDYKLLNASYQSDYAEFEYWEEIQKVDLKIFGGEGETEIITPYMKVWIFPPREFIELELQKSMKEHEFPGPSEENIEKEDGLKEEEREKIKENEKIMEKIYELSEKYGGNLEASLKFVNETGKVVFNLYVEINKEDILRVIPMLPKEITNKDVEIEMNFEELYEIIYTAETEMRDEEIESPEWAKNKIHPIAKLKEIKNGFKIMWKIRSMINSAKISPESAKKDVDSLFKDFVIKMMKGEFDDEHDEKEKYNEEIKEEHNNPESSLTGNVILFER